MPTKRNQTTRSRPYRKNDQAYVEQKNYTHVRQLLGYERIKHQETLEGLNQTLRLWSLWKNLYSVTMEQTSKRREGSRQIRTHAKTSRTPAQRLLDCPELHEEHSTWINQQLEKNNPFDMKKKIEAGLRAPPITSFLKTPPVSIISALPTILINSFKKIVFALI